MDIGYVRSKDCRGGDRRAQEHDMEYNNRLRKRRAKEKNRRRENKRNWR